ncbi:probable alpha,alpha-trehalose-phosphate synthase [UDP-forming] 7 [Tanacetum coccineum]
MQQLLSKRAERTTSTEQGVRDITVFNSDIPINDGSSIETKESVLVWQYWGADLGFGFARAKEMLDHLESVLANEPVVVKSGKYIVEIKPQVKVRQEDNPPEFQRICLKDFTKAAKHDKDGKTPPHMRVHKSHISGSGIFAESPTKGKITKKVAEDSKPNKVNVKVANECKPSSVLPPRAVLSSSGTTILLEASKGLVAEKISTSMAENGKQADFVLCIGDDRFDEDVFEIIGNAISGNMLSVTVYIQCITV